MLLLHRCGLQLGVSMNGGSWDNGYNVRIYIRGKRGTVVCVSSARCFTMARHPCREQSTELC
jgi:hypothetical protein